MDEKVLLGHGSGGSMMKRIIDEVFFAAFGNEDLLRGDDAAAFPLPAFGQNDSLAFSTDSFVVTPHFFPGGDIGRLAVCGTVNDVATSGAEPLYLSCGFILEEGLPMSDLKRICASMAACAQEAGVRIVTGDTKVVGRGSGDGIFINTSGIGILRGRSPLSGAHCRPGDKVLVSGTIGDHGITIMSCRESLGFEADIQSDAAPLNRLVSEVLQAAPNTRCFRDPTRGGLASTLNELAAQSGVDILVEEEVVPVKQAVLGACEMLGYDVFQVANEGKMVCVVPPDEAAKALEGMRRNRYGADAAIIGEIQQAQADRGPKVLLQTAFGSKRILDMLVGEQLPRIC
ncbi:MAG: hydrogenase expression/formation protein HypE [Eggerthellaceae bacterium]|nr:hydrogenase expression/formation protein HypE [Eggerthellaceae bacterium]